MVGARERFIEGEMLFNANGTEGGGGDGDVDALGVVTKACLNAERLAEGIHCTEVDRFGRGGIRADAMQEPKVGAPGVEDCPHGSLGFAEVGHAGAYDHGFTLLGDVVEVGDICEFSARSFEEAHAERVEEVGGVFVERG